MWVTGDANRSDEACIHLVFHLVAKRVIIKHCTHQTACVLPEMLVCVTLVPDEDYHRFRTEKCNLLSPTIWTFSQTVFTENLMGVAWKVSEIIKPLLFSWLISMWPWMKVKAKTTTNNVMHSHDWGSHLVKFDSFTGFWHMAGDGQTDRRQILRQTTWPHLC